MNNVKIFYKLLSVALTAILYSTAVVSADKNSTDTQNTNNNTNKHSFYIKASGPLFDWKTFEIDSKKRNITSDLNISLATGYQYNLNQNDRIRMDLELQNIFLRDSATKTLDNILSGTTVREKLTINGYYDVGTPVQNLKISFGAGVGPTLNLLKDNQIICTNDYSCLLNNLGLTIQSTIGLEYKLTDNISISSTLKYFYDLLLPFMQEPKYLFQSNQVAMGIQYTF